MPEFAGLFDRFNNLDQIKIEDVMKWLSPVPQQIPLENYIANRILYPQVVPISPSELKIDLAILREALRLDNFFINTTLRKIMIPANFLEFIPDVISLICAFIDGLLLERLRKNCFEDLWTISLSNGTEEIIGSILLPQFSDKQGLMEIKLEGKIFNIKTGSLNILPCPKEHCPIDFNLKMGKFLGKNKGEVELSGGKAGLIIDARSK